MPVAAEALPRPFGPYTLLERLGQGGMAEVLLARQAGIAGTDTDRLVAIKRVLPSLATDDDFVMMFLDELRIVSTLNHPNIGHILDMGRIGSDHYLAMEYIMGRDLAMVLKAAERHGARLPMHFALEIARQVTAALDHAHRRREGSRPLNIVHRDVSPDNVILTFDGGVKIVDFGIALAENRLSQTRAGMIKGKPPYMAPEQILGRTVDGRADIFSLGALLYRMVTRVHPFSASSPEKTFRRVVEETPVNPRELVPTIPAALSKVIMKALKKSPGSRYRDAQAFHDALTEVAVEHDFLPAPKRMAGWVASLFPDLADARERLAHDPLDALAAVSASYLSGSIVDDLPLPFGRPDPFEEALAEKKRARTGVDRSGRLPPDEQNTEPGVQLPGRDGIDGSLTEGSHDSGLMTGPGALISDARLYEDISYEDTKSTTQPQATPASPVPPAAPSPPRPPAAALRAEIWRLGDHWRHLPPILRSPVVVFLVGSVLTAIVLLAALGLRTWM